MALWMCAWKGKSIQNSNKQYDDVSNERPDRSKRTISGRTGRTVWATQKDSRTITMMKVNKDDLDDLTKAVIDLGIIAAALLAFTGCPVPEVYERIEKFVRDSDKMRGNLNLDLLAPDELTSGELSKNITVMLVRAQEAYKKKVGQEQINKDLSKMN